MAITTTDQTNINNLKHTENWVSNDETLGKIYFTFDLVPGALQLDAIYKFTLSDGTVAKKVQVLTDPEKTAFLQAIALWEAVANVHFEKIDSPTSSFVGLTVNKADLSSNPASAIPNDKLSGTFEFFTSVCTA